MKTTVKHVGSVREWEGPIENWESHVWEIKYWCDGGGVQFKNVHSGWVGSDIGYSLAFDSEVECRIKQREPKQSEVWISDELGRSYLMTSTGWIHLKDGKLCDSNREGNNMVYSAPSVEAYYARKFLNNN